MSFKLRASAVRIGELSRRSGASVRSLRYYEEQGLLPARRTSGGHREFLECAPARVAWIRRLHASGLNSAMIERLLPHMNEVTLGDEGAGSTMPGHVREQLQSELVRIDAAIDDLARSRTLLRQLLSEVTAEESDSVRGSELRAIPLAPPSVDG